MTTSPLLYQRFLSPSLADAREDTPVILVCGARQTGKTTLVQRTAQREGAPTYRTLDDATVLAAARADPRGFLESLPAPVVIDEVQHCPELFPAIKLLVDRERTPGRFVLTGSANVLLLPKLSESLAGRMEILTLYPLAQAEIRGGRWTVVDDLFAPVFTPADAPAVAREELARILLAGGYPEPLARNRGSRREQWFGAYLTAILQRDVRDIADIADVTQLPRILSVIASRTANLLNVTELSSNLAMPYATLHRYLAILEATYLVTRLPAWSGDLGARATRTPKVYLSDTGLAGQLMGLNTERLLDSVGGGVLLGALLETFVMTELLKQASWSQTRPALFHFRTQSRQEVDIVLERRGGEIVGIEVKAAATVSAADFKGLNALREATVGARFLRGIVFYTGDVAVAFGPDLYAVPLSFLWQ